ITSRKRLSTIALAEVLFPLRTPLELVFQRLERDGPEAVQPRGNRADRPVDLDLTRVVDAAWGRRRSIRASRVERRSARLEEGQERFERAVRGDSGALLENLAPT